MTDDETLKETSDAATRYYDSLTDEQVAEDRAWGEFSEAGLVETSWPDKDAYDSVSEEGLLGKSSTGIPTD